MALDFRVSIESPDVDKIRDLWRTERRSVSSFHAAYAACATGQQALADGDDGDCIDVLVASQEDGEDAELYTVEVSVTVDYDVSKPRPMSLRPPEVDENGDPVKGRRDDKTIALFSPLTEQSDE